jgi:hypothetical protein
MAYATQSEFVELCKVGATPCRPQDLTEAKVVTVSGKNTSRWYYFWPDKALEVQLAEKRQHKKVGTRDKL